MKRALLIGFLLGVSVCLCRWARSEEPSDSLSRAKPALEESLTDALRCIKMTPDDLRFRDDYVDVDSFRLELIDSLMRTPMATKSFNRQWLSDWTGSTPEQRRFSLPRMCADYLKMRRKEETLKLEDTSFLRRLNSKNERLLREHGKVLKKLTVPLERCVTELFESIMHSDLRTARAFDQLTEEERVFLRENLPVILFEDIEDEFKTPEELDQQGDYEEQLAEEMIPYLAKIRLKEIIYAGADLSFATQLRISALRQYLATQPQPKPLVKDKEDKANDLILRLKTSQGEIIVGGFGSSTYSGSPVAVIDLGGDDEYKISIDSTRDFASSVIIDLGGDDVYRAEGDFVYGSGFFGSGILVDLSGDDVYLGRNFSLGSGLFGVGVLIDEQGNDKYFGDTFCQGAGSFGTGFLVDMQGSDQYSAALFAQGFGFVSGLGALIDSSGNDNYFAGGRYKDILRYKDHYISLSQGFAYGLRPMMSGGIGMLFDLSGNDVYTSDIFGQGSSYWFSLGTLMDVEGNDNYVSFQYAQGAGTHLCLAILEDESGDDVYISHGVSQGCGHDLALGMLWDKSGHDNYVSESLSQGAGSANGFGILADEGGNDGYYVQIKANTQGYGNPRRDYGSVGILLDLSGRDGYDGNGADSTWWTTPSKWGVGIDR